MKPDEGALDVDAAVMLDELEEDSVTGLPSVLLLLLLELGAVLRGMDIEVDGPVVSGIDEEVKAPVPVGTEEVDDSITVTVRVEYTPVLDRLLTERDGDEVAELDPVVGEPSVLLEVAELPPDLDDEEAEGLVSAVTVSVRESVRVEVEVMLVFDELPVPAGEVEFAGAVGKPDELLDAPVLRETPVLKEMPVLSEGIE